MALFIGRLPSDCRPRELESLFTKYGRLTRCDIKRGGYGFIEYEDPRDAEDAIKSCDGMRFLGERIVVEWAKGARKSSNEECFKCGRTGHWARACPLLGGRNERDRDGRYGKDRSRERGYRRDYDRRERDYDRRDGDRYERDRDRERERGAERDGERDREYSRRDHSRSHSPRRGSPPPPPPFRRLSNEERKDQSPHNE